MANTEKEPHVGQDSFKAFREFIDEFKDESDRAAVILGAAKLDLLLFQLLKAFFLPSTSTKDELLDGDSPLGTFSAKIMLAHRIGLIDDEFCRTLHLIRKIRNSFAHELSGISLEYGPHRDRIRELVAPLLKSEAYEYLLERFFGDHAGPAAEFRTAVALASIRLEGAHDNRPPISWSAYRLLPPGYRKPSNTDSKQPG